MNYRFRPLHFFGFVAVLPLAALLLLSSCRQESPPAGARAPYPAGTGAGEPAGATLETTSGPEAGQNAAAGALVPDDNAWVARVDGIPLTAGEARRKVIDDSRLLHQLATVPTEKVLRQAVEGWVWETIEVKEAERRGIARKAKPEIDIERDLVTRYYYIRALAGRMDVSDTEVETRMPTPLVRLRISSRVFADESEAMAARAALLSGKAKWAETGESISPGSGGGWIWPYPNSGFLDKIQSDLVFPLKKGEYSPVMKTGVGYTILRVEERDKLSAKRIDRMRDTLRAQIRNEKVGKVIEQWRSLEKISRMDKGNAAEFSRLVVATVGISGGKRLPGDIVASVGEWKLGFDTLGRVSRKFAGYREKMGSEEKRRFLSGVLDSVITARVVAGGAARSGYSLDKAVEAELGRRKDGIIATALIDDLQASGNPVTDKDVREYYDANRDAFRNRRLLRVSHILVMNRKEANDLYGKISAGSTTFRQAEKDFSADETVGTGGDIGWVYPGRLVPELEGAVLSLKVGEVSAPVETRYGFHILTVTEAREEKDMSFDAARDEIREKLAREHTEKTKNAFIRDVRKNYRIEYNKASLTTLISRLESEKEGIFKNMQKRSRAPHAEMGTHSKGGMSPPHIAR